MNKENLKNKKIIIAVLVLVFGTFFILWLAGWTMTRSQLVAEGLASPNFPYLKYTNEELINKFGTGEPANITTTQTPEQTHAIFIEHLKNYEIDEAVECCFQKGKWNEMKEFIYGVKDVGKYDVMVNDLSIIEKDNQMFFDSQAIYLFNATGEDGKEKVGGIIEFVKDNSGKWLIKDF